MEIPSDLSAGHKIKGGELVQEVCKGVGRKEGVGARKNFACIAVIGIFLGEKTKHDFLAAIARSRISSPICNF